MLKLAKKKTDGKKTIKNTNTAKRQSLPKDTYTPLFESVEVEVDEARNFVINVQRAGELGLPCVDIRTYQHTEAYTGFTKKGINLPLSLLPDLIEALQGVCETAEEKDLFDEYKE